MQVEGVISSPGAHGQLVELLKMRRIMVPGDEDDVVEAELTQAMQPRASVVPGAFEIARIVGPVRARPVARQMHDHVGDDGTPTAQVAEPHDTLAQQSPAAPGAGPHPAVELAGRPLDPPRARPRADQHGWAAEGRGPDGLQRGSVHALAPERLPASSPGPLRPPEGRMNPKRVTVLSRLRGQDMPKPRERRAQLR